MYLVLSVQRLLLAKHQPNVPFYQMLKAMATTCPMNCIDAIGVVEVLNVMRQLGRRVDW